jgi:hypothetical protein
MFSAGLGSSLGGCALAVRQLVDNLTTHQQRDRVMHPGMQGEDDRP